MKKLSAIILNQYQSNIQNTSYTWLILPQKVIEDGLFDWHSSFQQHGKVTDLKTSNSFQNVDVSLLRIPETKGCLNQSRLNPYPR